MMQVINLMENLMRSEKVTEQFDPKHFGIQPNGTYFPAPAEIAQHCARIREQNSAKELRARAPWAYSDPCIVVEVVANGGDLTPKRGIAAT